MAEDGGELEQSNLDSAGTPVGYISLDQARTLALEHARANLEFYGEGLAGVDLSWEVAGESESEDRYEIRLAFRPSGEFRGKPGLERFTFDKSGGMQLRHVRRTPRNPAGLLPSLAAAVLFTVAIAGAAAGGLVAAGVFSTSADVADHADVVPPMLASTGVGSRVSMVAVLPEMPARLVSPDEQVIVEVAAGSVDRPVALRYESLQAGQVPQVPADSWPPIGSSIYR